MLAAAQLHHAYPLWQCLAALAQPFQHAQHLFNVTPVRKLTLSAWLLAAAPAVIPPGFQKAAGATIELCPDNMYRQTWVARTSTATCTACGDGILADAIEPITLYNNDYTEVNLRVKASSKSCCEWLLLP
jgi:hypothetical protein